MTAHPLNLFDSLWREVSEDHVITVQDRTELEYVFNLIKGCKSYLEIGTAEGKSLYVLAHALDHDAEITYVDLGEKHTEERRNYYLGKLNRKVCGLHGDSTGPNMHNLVKGSGRSEYEVVLIDAGHDTLSVMSDAVTYGPMATKYLLFHDVAMPDVGRVFDWYAARIGKHAYKLINSDHFGFGIVEIK